MLTSEAHDILRTIERRLKPARAPYHGDQTALDDWARLLTRYEQDQVRQAFAAHLEGGTGRWPNYYTLRDLLKRTRHTPSTYTDDCDNCAGVGWKAGDTMQLQGRNYSTAIPCDCPHGAQAERSVLYTEHAIGLCPQCNGVGYIADGPDAATKCDRCNGAGCIRPT